MDKIVNIEVRNPIRGFRTPLGIGKYYNVKMPVNDIFTCICGRALVDEVLSDGSLVRLDLTNFDKDNGASAVTVKEEKAEVEAPVAPVVEPEAPKTDAPVETNTDKEPVEEKKDEETTAPVVEPEASKVEDDEIPAAVNSVETKTEETTEEKKDEEPAKKTSEKKPSQNNRSNKSNKSSHK